MQLCDPFATFDLKPDKLKIQEVLLYLMNKKPRITQFQLVKSVWFADKVHLNAHGRPVTFDNYAAMPKGPVPSLALNALTSAEFDHQRQFGNPRQWKGTPKRLRPDAIEFVAERAADLDYLSQSDLAAMDEGLETVLKTSTEDMWTMLHEHPAYKEAWGKRGTKKSVPMKLSLIADESGDKLAAKLAYISAHA